LKLLPGIAKENPDVSLVPLQSDDREQFIKDNQEAFKYGAVEEFGMKDDHFNEEGEIISRKTIERSIDKNNSEAYRIMCNGRKVGGVVININKETLRGELSYYLYLQRFIIKGVVIQHGVS